MNKKQALLLVAIILNIFVLAVTTLDENFINHAPYQAYLVILFASCLGFIFFGERRE